MNIARNTRRASRRAALLLGSMAIAGCASTAQLEEVGMVETASDREQILADGYVSPDALFAAPYIDLQEWRDAPVRHYYVHGGFEGTSTRFSYYLPAPEQYDGRFFQLITPVPLSENLTQEREAGPFNHIGFSLASGGYFVETNGGGELDIANGSPQADPTIRSYRANAAAAQFSRHVARQFYVGAERPYGYAFGGSGGAYRTIGSIENTSGVWDGAVPFVPGSTMAIPNMFTVRVQAMRVLWDKFPQIIDAMEPGGSGDPYAGLNEREAAVLREVDRMGFPMQSWYAYETMGIHGFAALYPGVKMADPTYFTDFWTKPGYLGFDHPEFFDGARLQFTAEVAEPISFNEAGMLGLNTNAGNEQGNVGVDNAFEAVIGPPGERIVGYRLSEAPPPVRFIGGDVVIESGANAGRTMPAARIMGDVVILGFADDELAASVEAGDRIRIDNSDFLAMESYHRHQVPGPEFAVWDQFRDENGDPVYPQRAFLLGPAFTANTMGGPFKGEFDGKMILAASLWDREAMPWQADWYRQAYAENGIEVPVYFTDHALHGDEPGSAGAARTVPYIGTLQQSLRLLADWVEEGIEPPASTSYTIADGQVIVPDRAAQRKGLQPVVSLSVAGGERVDVRTGSRVDFIGMAEVPAAGGTLVSVEWDFEGDGSFEAGSLISQGAASSDIAGSFTYTQPGTYFVTLKVTAQPDDAIGTPYARLVNLDRVRVVVSD